MFKKLGDKLLDRVEDIIVREATEALAPHVEEFTNNAIDAIVNAAPKVKSTGGATGIYLKNIQKDFKDFHEDDANAAISTLLYEYLEIKCGQKDDFEKANVSNKIKLNIKKQYCDLTDFKINQISIFGYSKSLNSATIKYKVSAGYGIGRDRKEKLYEIHYTLQLKDEFEDSTFLNCKNCGAPLEESSGFCKYCGMKHIRDTITNWVVTSVTEK
jgi:hypothetical protein